MGPGARGLTCSSQLVFASAHAHGSGGSSAWHPESSWKTDTSYDLMSCSPVVKNLSGLGFQFYLDRSNLGV